VFSKYTSLFSYGRNLRSQNVYEIDTFRHSITITPNFVFSGQVSYTVQCYTLLGSSLDRNIK